MLGQESESTNGAGVEHFDVLIVGAGLSGVGAARMLQKRSPRRTFAVLEARDAIGGTWDLFRYPGIRSDSDMYTLGYASRPWEQAKAIADGPAIRSYITDPARETGIDRRIRFGHRVISAAWSSEAARWAVEVERAGSDQTVRMTCGFLFACTGYYRYDEGYAPAFEGTDRFEGEIVHPQFWPENLDFEGKRVIVVGSGATAVTLVPAMAGRADHVTMLQRSPSYVLSLPAQDPIAAFLRRRLPPRAAYFLIRWKNVIITQLFFQLSRRAPNLVRRLIRRGVKRRLPPGYDVDKHFEPRYDPWDQRVCLVPDGDLFAALSRGDASIVTDEIETFTERGLRLASGTELDADLIVTATGLNLMTLGGMQLSVDGREIDVSETFAYKGLMLSGVPNLALALGYTNASWTLKCDLVAEYVCRLLNHMDEHGYRQCTPLSPGPEVPTEPIIDLSAGYVLRSIDDLPQQGARTPWRLHQNYPLDILMLRHGKLEDEGVEFTGAQRQTSSEPVPV
jgi:cation diffusion facilitator CzcD-associated flavoprotein CzcO